MAGYQVGSACYSSTQQAVEAIAAQVDGSIQDVGGNPYQVDASFFSPSSITYQGTQLNGTGSFTKTVAIMPETCNLMDYQDAAQMSWLVVIAWVAAYAVVVLRRAV